MIDDLAVEAEHGDMRRCGQALAPDWGGGAWIGRWLPETPCRLNGALDEFVLTNYTMTAGEISGLMAGILP